VSVVRVKVVRIGAHWHLGMLTESSTLRSKMLACFLQKSIFGIKTFVVL
jgi:hypothetical protein